MKIQNGTGTSDIMYLQMHSYPSENLKILQMLLKSKCGTKVSVLVQETANNSLTF